MPLTLEQLVSTMEEDKGIGPFLTPEEIGEACLKASQETGWVFPVAGNFRSLWMRNRAERHCFEKLWLQSARKFKVEQLHLNQRFDHYGKILEKMDADFEKAINENPSEFTDVDRYKAFGSVAGTGLVYNRLTGKDVTRFVS